MISDRAFWLDEGSDGQVLAVVSENVPKGETKAVTPGQTLRFEAEVRSGKAKDELVRQFGQSVSAALEREATVLELRWRDIEKVASN